MYEQASGIEVVYKFYNLNPFSIFTHFGHFFFFFFLIDSCIDLGMYAVVPVFNAV